MPSQIAYFHNFITAQDSRLWQYTMPLCFLLLMLYSRKVKGTVSISSLREEYRGRETDAFSRLYHHRPRALVNSDVILLIQRRLSHSIFHTQ